MGDDASDLFPYTNRWFGTWANAMAKGAGQDGSPAWFYRFTRKPPPLAAELLLADSSNEDIASDQLGVPHGAELISVFGFTPILLTFDGDDRTFSDQVMTYWTNFAKTGHPNGTGLPYRPGYGSATQREYLDFGAKISPRSGLDVELFHFVETTWLNSAY